MPERRRLEPCQQRALDHVRQLARNQACAAWDTLLALLQQSGTPVGLFEEARAGLRHLRIGLHFHPDRRTPAGVTVAAGLLAEGMYRSQFETGVSGGSPTAFPGGARDEWERQLFGGAYHTPQALRSGRPRYGALRVLSWPDGPAPRFGSCYLVLRPEVSTRSTFTYGDSHTRPATVGTLDMPDSLLAALLTDVSRSGAALGARRLTIRALLAHLGSPSTGRPEQAGRVLDDYIEAQVHGPVELIHDAESLVADPAFRGSEIGAMLQQVCRTYGILLEWHQGFVLPATEVPEAFRGPEVVRLARHVSEITGSELLDAAVIGRAAASFDSEPGQWGGWSPRGHVLRRFRQLWHVLVRFGQPAGAADC